MKTFDTVVRAFTYEKTKIWKAFGEIGFKPDPQRLANSYQAQLMNLATLCDAHNLDPDMVVEAMFALAKKQKHAGGPMPNVMGSIKYLKNAVANYLDVPVDVALAQFSVEQTLKRCQAGYETSLEAIAGRRDLPGVDRVTAIAMMTHIPVFYRFAALMPSAQAMRLLGAELLEGLSESSTARLWLNQQGWTYDRLADFYNRSRSCATAS